MRKLMHPITMFTKNSLQDGNLADDPVFALLESLPEEAFLIDPNGSILTTNTLFATRFGLSVKECIGAMVYDLIATVQQLPKLALHYREKSEEVLRTGNRMVFEDGTENLHWKFTLNPLLSPDGKITRMCITIADISEQKRIEVEKALESSEKMFRSIAEQISEIVFVTDKSGMTTYVSPAVKTITGYTTDEVIGHRFIEFIVEEDIERAVSSFQQGLMNRIDEVLEYRYRKKDGTIFYAEVHVQYYEHQGFIGYIGLIRDITARKQIEEEKANLAVQLQQSQKMEMIGQLAGGIAHDFNNMLTVILGHTEIAMQESDPGMTTYADFDAIRQAATHSANLTRQLLAFARKQVISPKIVEMNSSITEMLPMLRRVIGENISLTWIPECKNCHVNIDPSQIDQILVNLCINARDAITGNGKITIENHCLSLPKKEGEDHKTEDIYVSLSVHDDGRGIKQNDLQHIFEPFFTTKESGKGTGLGLSTVYGIVKQNHGNINCLSEPGKGTTVTIQLPKHKIEATTNLKREQEQLPQKGHQTILLVEDEPGILKLCKLILERNGYTVLAFERAVEAINMEKGYNGTLDLLVTDIMMPEMNGSELAKKLLASRPDLKVLFISGYTADVIAHNTILDSQLNFIQKPFSSISLTTIVHNILNSELQQKPGSV